MTTKVVVACPDNSVHDAHVYIESKVDDAWVRNTGPVVVAPREQADPIYLTQTTRVVIEEAPRATAEPHA